MEAILSKLRGLDIKDYSRVFSYGEKMTLLQVLIDGIHELSEFRQLLS